MNGPADMPPMAEQPVEPSQDGPPVVGEPSFVAEGTPRRRYGCGILIVASALSACIGATAGLAASRLAGWTPGAPEVNVVEGSTAEPVAAAAAAALPCVVNLDVTSETSRSAGGGLPKGHPSVPIQGTGSGVAFRAAPAGGTYLITNQHVVEGAEDIVATLPDGRPVAATVIGSDKETDIAVVRIRQRLPLIRIGDSEKLVIGQTVVSIGSPFGLRQSVSAGVVSSLHRSLSDILGDPGSSAYPLVDVIQTDARINPGNSGGALVDRTGRFIGMPISMFTDSGDNEGVGFAIPSKTVVRIADELISGRKATHPFLGIIGQTVDKAAAASKELPVDEGALVHQVEKGTGAARAGVRAGDVIVALDGKAVRSMDDLLLHVRRTKVGQTVRLRIYRGSRPMELRIRIGDKPPGQ